MVDRAARAYHAHWHPDYAHAWDSERDDIKAVCVYEVTNILRAALALPPEWEPEG